MQPASVVVRKATREDVPLLLDFIRGIADYEKMSDDVVATEELLEYWMFECKVAEAILAVVDGVEAGFALYFFNFSTFESKAGLYLEDIFVWPEHRGKGIGTRLFHELAKIAVAEGCGRFEWVCLDWNQPSIDFYLSLGAKPMEEWTIYRLDGKRLEELAG